MKRLPRCVLRGWTVLLLVAACDGSVSVGGRDDGGGPPDPDDSDGGPPRADAAPVGGDDGGPPSSGGPAFCADYPPADLASAKQATAVRYGDDGFLVYASDDEGNRVPDFGHAGYHFGERDLPAYPEVASIGPGDGDDTARIQDALDELAARTPDANGVRGALRLEPGTYQVAGTLRVAKDGMVLRGSGDGGDPAVDTILQASGDNPHQRSVIVLGMGGSGAWRNALPDTQVNVTTPFVPVGANAFEVDHPEKLAVGQRVIVKHPSTQAWIDRLGGGGASVDWNPGEIDVFFVRRVVGKDGDQLTLDVPIFDHLDRSLATSVVFAIDDGALVRESGVEQLRVDVQTAGGEDENHAWSAFDVAGAEDAWVSDVTALHFGYAAVKVHNATRITVRRAKAREPVAIVTGSRLYHFDVDEFAQQVLFVDCEASNARHAFVSNGTSSVSGVVWLRGKATKGYTSSEGHRRWSQGLLYDNIVETQQGDARSVGLYNRGDWGTQHGWAAVHSVIWRYDTGGKTAVIQKPPTAQNWAIGTLGTVTGAGPFAGSIGHSEPVAGAGELAPHSLYEAQVCDRLARAAAGK
jgi:hypothetical protein